MANDPVDYAVPLDTEIGGDGDIGGIAQRITEDDIQAIVVSDKPIEQRREALKNLHARVEARERADGGDDMSALRQSIEGALHSLDGAAVIDATRADIGHLPYEADIEGNGGKSQ